MVVIVVVCINPVVAFVVVVVLSETVVVVVSCSSVSAVVVVWMCWTVNGSAVAIGPLALVVMHLVSIECFVCRVVARAFVWIVDW